MNNRGDRIGTVSYYTTEFARVSMADSVKNEQVVGTLCVGWKTKRAVARSDSRIDPRGTIRGCGAVPGRESVTLQDCEYVIQNQCTGKEGTLRDD